MKKYLSIVLLGLVLSGVAVAQNDPMKSLFLFQQKMADNGSAAAMMKLGEMYEQGQGTEQSFDKALEMYEKARAAGHGDAQAAIARVKRAQQAQSQAASEEAKRAREARRRAEEAKRRAEAEREAEEARKAREAARQKARQEALAKQRAEERARREAEAKARREAEARAREAAREKAQAEARRKAQEQARLEQARARAEAKAKAKAVKKSGPTESQPEQADTDQEEFKSDPCKGPAARVMSICK